MIDKYIKTVKDQIAYFDSILKKNPSNAGLQANFWGLKHQFEQLLCYLEGKTPEPAWKPPLAVWNAVKKTEDDILQIIKAHPDGIHTSNIRILLEKNLNKIFTDSVFNNRIYNMYSKKKLIERIKKGVYVLKTQN